MTIPAHVEAPGDAATSTRGQVNIRVGSSEASLPPLADNIGTGRPTDLGSLSSEAFAGYLAGSVDGFRQGYAACEADIDAAVARHSVELVHNLSKIPARDHLTDRRQAQQRDAWWSRRRGEAA